MITKAIVEEIISPYKVRVRIPLLNRTQDSPLSTKTENLNIATICSLPNCYVNLQVGDVVFVGFEDNTAYKAIVLGHLCREASGTSCADLILNRLTTNSSATLPSDTTIGSVQPTQLSYLKNLSADVQGQLDLQQSLIDKLLQKVFPEEYPVNKEEN